MVSIKSLMNYEARVRVYDLTVRRIRVEGMEPYAALRVLTVKELRQLAVFESVIGSDRMRKDVLINVLLPYVS